MISLIVISCIVAAFTPVITKKLSSGVVSIGGGSSGSDDGPTSFGDECKIWDEHCLVCNKKGCMSCDSNLEPCNNNEHRNGLCQCERCDTSLNDINCLKCSGTYDAKCTLCSDGFGIVKGKCVQCVEGTYSSLESGLCENCPDGMYSSIGSTECSDCGYHHYCKDGRKTACPDGLITSITNASSINDCKACPEGWVCPSDSEPKKCEGGTYIISQKSPCRACAKGYYCDGKNKITCPDGTYSDIEGATSCKPCTEITNCIDCVKETGACTRCTDGMALKSADGNNRCGIAIVNQAQCNALAASTNTSPMFSTLGSYRGLKWVLSAMHANGSVYNGTCVMRVNAGDFGTPLPPTLAYWGNASNKAACVNAAVIGNTADTRYCKNSPYYLEFGNYSSCNRTVCNWFAANDICEYYNQNYNPDKNNYKFRLPDRNELKVWGDTNIVINSLNLCHSDVNNSNYNCNNLISSYCPNNQCIPSSVWGHTTYWDSNSYYYAWLSDATDWNIVSYAYNLTHTSSWYGKSVRCVLE